MKNEDHDDIVNKYTTNSGCYRFAAIVHFLTGWNVGDLHTDGNSHEKYPTGEYKYVLGSAHAFCYDSDGNVFDVEGKATLESFLNQWLKVKEEYIGKIVWDRLWPEKLNYKIVLYDDIIQIIDFLSYRSYSSDEEKMETLDMISFFGLNRNANTISFKNQITEVMEVYNIFKNSYPDIDVETKYEVLLLKLNEKLKESQRNDIKMTIDEKKNLIYTYNQPRLGNDQKILKLKEQITNLEKIPDPIKRQNLISSKQEILHDLEIDVLNFIHRINSLEEEINSLELELNSI
jgi:hypothetical protein